MKCTACSILLFAVGFSASLGYSQIPYPNPINHVIVIDQENRTVDNLFGSNSAVNQYYLPQLVVSTVGQAYNVVDGKKHTFTVQAVPIPLPSLLNSPGSVAADDYDPDHAHIPSWIAACHAPAVTDPSTECAMDGFNHVTVSCDE